MPDFDHHLLSITIINTVVNFLPSCPLLLLQLFWPELRLKLEISLHCFIFPEMKSSKGCQEHTKYQWNLLTANMLNETTKKNVKIFKIPLAWKNTSEITSKAQTWGKILSKKFMNMFYNNGNIGLYSRNLDSSLRYMV